MFLALLLNNDTATNITKAASKIDCDKECPCGVPIIPVPEQWLEVFVVGGFKVWHIIFIVIAFIITMVVVYCCFHKCRIPRTKQEIEADLMRSDMTNKFRDHLQNLPPETATFIEALKKVQELEEKLEQEQADAQGAKKRMGWLKLKAKDEANRQQQQQANVNAETNVEKKDGTGEFGKLLNAELELKFADSEANKQDDDAKTGADNNAATEAKETNETANKQLDIDEKTPEESDSLKDLRARLEKNEKLSRKDKKRVLDANKLRDKIARKLKLQEKLEKREKMKKEAEEELAKKRSEKEKKKVMKKIKKPSPELSTEPTSINGIKQESDVDTEAKKSNGLTLKEVAKKEDKHKDTSNKKDAKEIRKHHSHSKLHHSPKRKSVNLTEKVSDKKVDKQMHSNKEVSAKSNLTSETKKQKPKISSDRVNGIEKKQITAKQTTKSHNEAIKRVDDQNKSKMSPVIDEKTDFSSVVIGFNLEELNKANAAIGSEKSEQPVSRQWHEKVKHNHKRKQKDFQKSSENDAAMIEEETAVQYRDKKSNLVENNEVKVLKSHDAAQQPNANQVSIDMRPLMSDVDRSEVRKRHSLIKTTLKDVPQSIPDASSDYHISDHDRLNLQSSESISGHKSKRSHSTRQHETATFLEPPLQESEPNRRPVPQPQPQPQPRHHHQQTVTFKPVAMSKDQRRRHYSKERKFDKDKS